MSVDLIRGLYEHHRWANRRLFDHVQGLGEEPAGRALGPQWSAPTIRQMLAHIYGADALWLSRWTDGSLKAIPGGDISTLADLRAQWDVLEAGQRAFLERLLPADLGRMVHYENADGQRFQIALGPLLLHVANHATHHRSEVATMVTLISGSPPETGRVIYELIRTGQMSP